MTNVDVFLLDWNEHRPFGGSRGTLAVQAFDAGRYEYSFSHYVESPRGNTQRQSDIYSAEAAYMAQGNNAYARKVRIDRQTMSAGDAVLVDGRAYVAASIGFERVAELDTRLPQRIEGSWSGWTEREEKDVPAPVA